MHRIFCATPWELEEERYRFCDLVGQFNEKFAMQRGVLFVPLTLPNILDKRPLQYVVDGNIRTCRHYLLLTRDDWGPAQRNFRDEYALALRAVDDPALPMKSVAVLAKELPPDMSRAESLPGFSATFSTTPEFDACVNTLLSGWLGSLFASEESAAASVSS